MSGFEVYWLVIAFASAGFFTGLYIGTGRKHVGCCRVDVLKVDWKGRCKVAKDYAKKSEKDE